MITINEKAVTILSYLQQCDELRLSGGKLLFYSGTAWVDVTRVLDTAADKNLCLYDALQDCQFFCDEETCQQCGVLFDDCPAASEEMRVCVDCVYDLPDWLHYGGAR